MLRETAFIWMDGKLVPWKEATVHVLAHSLHYGLGVFEGIRFYQQPVGSAVFRLREHVERLLGSARIVQMKIPYAQNEIERAVLDVVRASGVASGYIRPIAFIGYGEMGLFVQNNPIHLCVAAWPWGTYLGEEGLKNGIRVCVSSFWRHHVNISMTRAKVTGYYVNSQLAKQEAKQAGYDEALLLDTEGYVAEGPGENIFIVRKGTLRTTPPTSILEGITRDAILQLAQERDIPAVQTRFTRDDLYLADEAFFTGTAAEVTPIREVDGRVIAAGKPGPVTQALQSAFFDVVSGKDARHAEWLTRI